MNTDLLYEYALFTQVALGVSCLCVMKKKRILEIYPHLAYLLGMETLTTSIIIALLFFRSHLHLSRDVDYWALFLTGWLADGLGLILRILIVYSVFTEAMRPLAGLHAAGKIVFRWVGVVSTLVATALLAGPGVFSGLHAWNNVVSHLQQGVSVLTLCLLVFVCFTVRPLGLTFRSHLFGVSLGLGISSTVDLVRAAWLVTAGARSVYSPIFLFASIGTTVSYLVWAGYFAAPEPERRMILLPTTSPFFFWNRISEILGDAPGQVAVAGFSPGMLAPAEIEMLTAATSTGETVSAEITNVHTARIEPSILSSLGGVRYSSSLS